jgi:hypothetical protein
MAEVVAEEAVAAVAEEEEEVTAAVAEVVGIHPAVAAVLPGQEAVALISAARLKPADADSPANLIPPA